MSLLSYLGRRGCIKLFTVFLFLLGLSACGMKGDQSSSPLPSDATVLKSIVVTLGNNGALELKAVNDIVLEKDCNAGSASKEGCPNTVEKATPPSQPMATLMAASTAQKCYKVFAVAGKLIYQPVACP